jgi:hypothetical protein
MCFGLHPLMLRSLVRAIACSTVLSFQLNDAAWQIIINLREPARLKLAINVRSYGKPRLIAVDRLGSI